MARTPGGAPSKRCPKCAQTKPGSHFGADRRTPDGQKCWCRRCRRLSAHARYRLVKASPEFREKTSEAAIASRGRSSRNYLRYLLGQTGSRGSHRHDGLPLEHVLDLFEKQAGRCFYSGLPMTWTMGQGRVDTNMSLERLDPSRGYEPGNVVLCCYFINVSKRSKSIEEWLHWAEAVWQHRSNQPQIRLVSSGGL